MSLPTRTKSVCVPVMNNDIGGVKLAISQLKLAIST
jgi:hypothetical protein